MEIIYQLILKDFKTSLTFSRTRGSTCVNFSFYIFISINGEEIDSTAPLLPSSSIFFTVEEFSSPPNEFEEDKCRSTLTTPGNKVGRMGQVKESVKAVH
jgi:hypothetical protein